MAYVCNSFRGEGTPHKSFYFLCLTGMATFLSLYFPPKESDNSKMRREETCSEN